MEHIVDDAGQFGVRAQVEPDADRSASEAYHILHLPSRWRLSLQGWISSLIYS